MKTHALTLGLLCTLLVGSALSAAPAAAEELSLAPATTGFDLGTPARQTAVDEALTSIGSEPERALALVKALAKSRGVEAARGLATLAEHRDAAVRTEALLAMARVGLRGEAMAEVVHERLVDGFGTKRERWAAVVALGAVGDGRDVQTLLDLASPDQEDGEIRTAAFRALAAITRTRLPYVHARWAYWWKKQNEKAEDRVLRAIEGLQRAPGAASAPTHEAILATYGWIMPDTVQAALKRWLTGRPRGLEAVACRLTAYHRFADLAPQVRRVTRGRLVEEEILKAARNAARRLGVAQETPAR